MEINLRQADQFQQAIVRTLRTISVDPMFTLSPYQKLATSIHKAHTKLLAQDQRQQLLLAAYHDIQQQIIAANTTNGINVLLNQIAYLTTRIKQLAVFYYAEPLAPLEVVQGTLDKIIRNTSEYGLRTITSSYLTTEQRQAFRKKVRLLQRQRQKLMDKTLDLNLRTKIMLSEETVFILTVEEIIK